MPDELGRSLDTLADPLRAELGGVLPPRLICYASRTGTLANIEALRSYGWRLLISPGRNNAYGMPYALDNGAWVAHQAGTSFNEEKFELLLDQMGRGADWVVLPDIVAGGLASLELSTRWLNRCLSASSMALLAVQDGMTEEDVAGIVGPSVGVFLGGSTGWKLHTMASWGAFCRARRLHYHVGRVNTAKRFAMAVAAGASSVDGSSASRYRSTIRPLDLASRQGDLFA